MITDLDLILADLQANWILYLSMPFAVSYTHLTLPTTPYV